MVLFCVEWKNAWTTAPKKFKLFVETRRQISLGALWQRERGLAGKRVSVVRNGCAIFRFQWEILGGNCRSSLEKSHHLMRGQYFDILGLVYHDVKHVRCATYRLVAQNSVLFRSTFALCSSDCEGEPFQELTYFKSWEKRKRKSWPK